jgi:hypothetical protein
VNPSAAARRGAVIGAAAALVLLFAPRAHAGILVSSAPSCDDVQLSQPFTPWLDSAQYFSIGGFENGGSGWTLSGGAAVASGNEPWQVSGAADSHSLEIPPGASATSPTACVGLDSPTLRFFARRSATGLLGGASLLKVDALVTDNAGNVVTVPVLATGAGTSWGPTVPMPVLASLLPLLPGDHTPIAFKFTAVGPADWHIDDTHVDPWHCC